MSAPANTPSQASISDATAAEEQTDQVDTAEEAGSDPVEEALLASEAVVAATAMQKLRLNSFLKDSGLQFSLVTTLLALAAYTGTLELHWIGTYLRFLLILAAGVLWIEVVSSWPESVQLHASRHPQGVHWRMVVFAYALQLTVIGFILVLLYKEPKLIAPIISLAVVGVAWYLYRRVTGVSGPPKGVHIGEITIPAAPLVFGLVVVGTELILELTSDEYMNIVDHVAKWLQTHT